VITPQYRPRCTVRARFYLILTSVPSICETPRVDSNAIHAFSGLSLSYEKINQKINQPKNQSIKNQSISQFKRNPRIFRVKFILRKNQSKNQSIKKSINKKSINQFKRTPRSFRVKLILRKKKNIIFFKKTRAEFCLATVKAQ
jgi:hypothetical protein